MNEMMVDLQVLKETTLVGEQALPALLVQVEDIPRCLLFWLSLMVLPPLGTLHHCHRECLRSRVHRTSSSANGSSTTRGRWNWTDTSTFAYGVNLGNCYMLEKVRSQSTETACSVNKFYILQWMNEDLFAKNAPGAVDHWTFECVDLAKNEIELIQ